MGALPDMAEAWWKEPKTNFYMGREFTHIPNSTCGHISDVTRNNKISKYLNDINCFACLELLKQNGNIYSLKEGISPTQQSEIDQEKYRFRYGKCSCGSPMCIRKNSKTKVEFLGCRNYPKCKNTLEIPKD